MDDADKIELLKSLGVWSSLKSHSDPTLKAFVTYYDTWDEKGEKRCRIYFEFKPAILLQDDNKNLEFMASVFELISEIQESATPDMPDKINMIDWKEEE